jgi:hypothetical protein
MSQSNTARVPSEEGEESQRTARRPEHTARVGKVEIAVWKNQGANGEFFTASSPVIRYKDDYYSKIALSTQNPDPELTSWQKAAEIAKNLSSPDYVVTLTPDGSIKISVVPGQFIEPPSRPTQQSFDRKDPGPLRAERQSLEKEDSTDWTFESSVQ